jgi:hypothetical protein
MRNPTLPAVAGLVALAAIACAPAGPAAAPSQAQAAATASSQDAFWENLSQHCGNAYEGVLLQAPEGDTQVDPEARLVVHFRECGDEIIRAPFHIDENRSRTWVFFRHDGALELRHDHRHEDGTEEDNTWYGAVTRDAGTPARQEFVSERNGVVFGWRVEIVPGERYTYGTIRNGQWRHHLEFDLTRPVDAPPPPWGHETRPTGQPTGG